MRTDKELKHIGILLRVLFSMLVALVVGKVIKEVMVGLFGGGVFLSPTISIILSSIVVVVGVGFYYIGKEKS